MIDYYLILIFITTYRGLQRFFYTDPREAPHGDFLQN